MERERRKQRDLERKGYRTLKEMYRRRKATGQRGDTRKRVLGK